MTNTSYGALHIVVYDGIIPIATSRVKATNNSGSYQIGLIAVDKSRRGQHLGEKAMLFAMEYIASHGGREIFLTAQQPVVGFYKKLGFEQSGDIDVFESGFVLVPMRFKFAIKREYKIYLLVRETFLIQANLTEAMMSSLPLRFSTSLTNRRKPLRN